MEDIKRFEPLFGNWYVERLIGEGSFGRVYAVKRTDFGVTRYAAVKHISLPQNESERKQLQYDGMDAASISQYYDAVVKDFGNEIRLMMELKDDPNVVQYEDHQIIKKADGIGYDILIRMELLTSLNEYILQHTMIEADVIKLGIDLSGVLILCENKRILHRDIKPDNIFVSDDGCFKLGDFGIARQLEHTATNLSKKGTFNYMAPEVYHGENYDHTADIYSLGLVLYRLLNGNRLPFVPANTKLITDDARERAMVTRMKGAELPLIEGVSLPLMQVLRKACAFESGNRYKSAQELLRALEQTLKSATADARQSLLLMHTENNTDEDELADAPAKCMQSERAAWENNGTVALFPRINAGAVTQEKIDVQKEESVSEKKDKGKRKVLASILCVSIAVFIAACAIEIVSYSLRNKAQQASIEPVTPTARITLNESDSVTALPQTERPTAAPTEAPIVTTEVRYSNWSEWSDEEVQSSDTREVETRTEYRYRTKQFYTEASAPSSNWVKIEDSAKWGEYGAYSAWSEEPVTASNSKQVENKTQYRYRTVTSTSSYSDWSDWGSWSAQSMTADDYTDVQTQTAYFYYYFACNRCGQHYPAWDTNCYLNCGSSGYVAESSCGIRYSAIPYSQNSANWQGTGRYSQMIDGSLYFRAYNETRKQTQYRSRTRTLITTKTYGSWQSWQDERRTNQNQLEEEKRVLYRYRVRSKVYTFWRWQSWSNWSTEIVTANNNRSVETRIVYRYREQEN